MCMHRSISNLPTRLIKLKVRLGCCFRMQLCRSTWAAPLEPWTISFKLERVELPLIRQTRRDAFGCKDLIIPPSVSDPMSSLYFFPSLSYVLFFPLLLRLLYYNTKLWFPCWLPFSRLPSNLLLTTWAIDWSTRISQSFKLCAQPAGDLIETPTSSQRYNYFSLVSGCIPRHPTGKLDLLTFWQLLYASQNQLPSHPSSHMPGRLSKSSMLAKKTMHPSMPVSSYRHSPWQNHSRGCIGGACQIKWDANRYYL